MVSKADLFSENMPSRVIPGFPYAERFCKYCQRKLSIWKAFHVQGDEDIYKAILICLNPDCESYDEDAKDAYVRVYYSSQLAYDMLNLKLVTDPRSVFSELRKN